MIGLSLAAFALAFLELEAASAGIFMLSRPVIIGVGLGLAFQQAAAGWNLGILVEMLSLENLPLGSELVPNAVVAAGMALLFAFQPNALPLCVALPAGLCLGAVYCLMEKKIKSWKGVLAARAVGREERTGDAPLREFLALGLALEWALTALFLLAGLWFLKPLLGWAWPRAPECAREGLNFAYALAPGLGLAALARGFIVSTKSRPGIAR